MPIRENLENASWTWSHENGTWSHENLENASWTWSHENLENASRMRENLQNASWTWSHENAHAAHARDLEPREPGATRMRMR
jgi:hypothetical protein